MCVVRNVAIQLFTLRKSHLLLKQTGAEEGEEGVSSHQTQEEHYRQPLVALLEISQ